MFRKILYNTNSSQNHEVFIDDLDNSQNNSFSYFRFTDLTTNENRKSISQRLVSIAILISVFLLGFFTYYLISPTIIESQKPLLCDNENLDNKSEVMITHDYERIANTTISSATESNYHNYTIENIHNMITEATLPYVTEGTSTERTVTEETVKSTITTVTSTGIVTSEGAVTSRGITTVTPDSTIITDMMEWKRHLEDCPTGLTQFKKIPFTDGVDNYCVNEPIGIKSVVDFVASDAKLFDCLFGDEPCDKEFHDHVENDKLSEGMKHIRYNFIVDDKGWLYEGRPLNCNFDDIRHVNWGSKGYNDSEIIIGMPSCHKLNSEKHWLKYEFYFYLNLLMDCLREGSILSETYIMKFDKNCENYLTGDFISVFGKRIQFVHRDVKEKKYKDDYDFY